MKPILLSAATTLALVATVAGNGWAQTLSTTEKGLLGGALLGAGSGAIIGAGMHHAGSGALIGGGLGAVTGGVIGHEMQGQEYEQRRLQSELSAQQREINHQRAEIEQLQQAGNTAGSRGIE